MSWIKLIWGLLFRLFPCPTAVGLRRIGNPGRDSPVLVTCNFDLTVRRLMRTLRGQDVWLLVAESKGVNVWCAAGAKEFNTHSVVAAVKTSGIDDLVDHRELILPPYGGPGVRRTDVEQQTGWTASWGPVYGADLPRFLAGGKRRDPAMRRARYGLWERLDTGLGSMFAFYLAGVAGFAIFGRTLLLDFVAIGAVVFVLFYALVPWIPGKHGWVKATVPGVLLGAVWLTLELTTELAGFRLRGDFIIAIVMFQVYGGELGGLASTMASEFDPMMAKLGVRALGNVSFAGTLRTDLLNGNRTLTLAADRCSGCRDCFEVCPLDVWELDEQEHAVLARREACTACCACVLQCASGAIRAEKTGS